MKERSNQWINSTLGEFRVGHLHAGVDIRGYKGTKIYPVLDGVVDRIGNNYVKINSQGDFLDYVHIVPSSRLYVGKRVYANSTLLGVTDEVNHLHFEINDGGINPLKHLSPYQDLGRCVVYPFSFFYEGSNRKVTSTFNNLLKLSGKVDILAKIRDIQSQGNPDTAPYKISYKIFNSQGKELLDINNITFDTVKGKSLGWIYDIKNSTNSNFYYWVTNKPNRGSFLDTTNFLDGEYKIVVYADDIDGGGFDIAQNKGAETLKVYFKNGNTLPSGLKPKPYFQDIWIDNDEVVIEVLNDSNQESDEGLVVISFPELISRSDKNLIEAPQANIYLNGDSYPFQDALLKEIKHLTLVFKTSSWGAGELKRFRFKLKEGVKFLFRASLHIPTAPKKPFAYIHTPSSSNLRDQFFLPALEEKVSLEAVPKILQIIPSPIIASDFAQDVVIKGRNFTPPIQVEWRSENFPTPHLISSSKVKVLNSKEIKLQNIKITKGSHWWEFRVKSENKSSNWFRVEVINLDEEEVEVEDPTYLLAKELEAKKEIPIKGYFAQFGSGVYDWIYLSRDGKILAKLEGLDPQGGIKWRILKGFGISYIQETRIDNEVIYLQGVQKAGIDEESYLLAKRLVEIGSFEIKGYFAYFGDEEYDPFDWVYLTANKKIFAKLEGLNPNGTFKWKFLKLGDCSYFQTIQLKEDKIILQGAQKASCP